MPSCWTFLLKRRNKLSKLSPSVALTKVKDFPSLSGLLRCLNDPRLYLTLTSLSIIQLVRFEFKSYSDMSEDTMSTEPLSQTNIGEELTLTLESIGSNGEALAEYKGQTVGVFGGIPGELVLAKIAKVHKFKIEAHVIQVITPSSHRVSPPCPIFWPCTGCQWQHIDYGHQLHLKRSIVQQSLNKYPNLLDVFVHPTIPSPKTTGYRNHARFTIGSKGMLGFVNRTTRSFVPVQKCLLMHSSINRTLELLQGHCSETSQLSIRYGVNSGDLLIQPKLRGIEPNFPTGQKYYFENLHGRSFRVGSPSFFQVNTSQAEAMVDIAKDLLRPSGKEILVDAYAGVGVFAALLAPYVGKVLALEESEAAIKDSKENFAGLSNVEPLQGKVEDLLPTLDSHPDLVLLDPPRAGCHPRTLETLNNLPPHRILYISCDPTTLSRDLAILKKGCFNIEKIQPIDLFPHTHHIECMVSMVNSNREREL